MFTDFVCFQFYFRDYVAQPCSKIGTAYICSSIKVLSRNAQRRIFVDCAGVRFIMSSYGIYSQCRGFRYIHVFDHLNYKLTCSLGFGWRSHWIRHFMDLILLLYFWSFWLRNFGYSSFSIYVVISKTRPSRICIPCRWKKLFHLFKCEYCLSLSIFMAGDELHWGDEIHWLTSRVLLVYLHMYAANSI